MLRCEQADIHEPFLRVQIWGMSNQEQTGAGLKHKKTTFQVILGIEPSLLSHDSRDLWICGGQRWGIWCLLSSHRVRHHRSINNWSWTANTTAVFFWNSGVSLLVLVDLIFELRHVLVMWSSCCCFFSGKKQNTSKQNKWESAHVCLRFLLLFLKVTNGGWVFERHPTIPPKNTHRKTWTLFSATSAETYI